MSGAWRLIERESGRLVVNHLAIADGYWSRMAGLQLRSRPAEGSGLLLLPCSSIHTFFMRFAIDAVLIDSHCRVVDVRRDIRPWRILVPSRSTYSILEVPSRSEGIEIAVGTILGLEQASGTLPKFSKRIAPWLLANDRP